MNLMMNVIMSYFALLENDLAYIDIGDLFDSYISH